MNKRLIAVFICLAILVLIVVCGAIVFTVKNIDVLVAGDNASIDKAQIVASSGIKKGVSIFTLDEKEISINIEKSVPYAKVTDIERVFPNKVRISIEYRQAILAVAINGAKDYLIVDGDMKILEVTNQLIKYNVIKVDGLELDIKDKENISAGNFIDVKAAKISSLYGAVAGFADVGIKGDRFLDFTRRIEFRDKDKQMIVTTAKGVKLLIRCDINAEEKLQSVACYNKFNTLNDSEREDGSFYVYVNNNGDYVYSDIIKFS